MLQAKYDVAIVGGGIVGLANAWMAARRGLSVVLFERDRSACGASIRNFGMVWPIGQPIGELFALALESRSFWLELQREAGVWVNECGSIHLARSEDEQAVLEEFLQKDPRSSELELLSPSQVAARSAAANPDGLLCGMWSPFELCVNPTQAIQQLANWLADKPKVVMQAGVTVTRIADGMLTTSDGQTFSAERIAVCSGSDFVTLFPEVFRQAGLTKCKLQMLATGAQPSGWKLGPHLAGGLTLRHYSAFTECSSLANLKARIASEQPLLDRYGIHVMASQNNIGQVVLGDSHVYDDDITPFDSQEIDNLILQELQSLIRLPDFQIQRRWHGVYAKHPQHHVLVIEPEPNCRVITAVGGAGMTLSFGIANQIWEDCLAC